MRALRILVRLFVFALLFVALTVGLVWAFGDEQWTRAVRFSELRDQKVIHLEKLELHVVLYKGEVYAVVDHHFWAGVKPIDVTYCEKSGLLESQHALFDRRGRYYGGAAERGLSTYPAGVRDGWVVVDLQDARPGLPRVFRGDEPIGPFCT